MFADPKTPESLRRDALQIRLLTSSSTEARKLAMEVVKSGKGEPLEIALVYLAMGGSELNYLRDSFYIRINNGRQVSVRTGNEEQGAIPEPPKGLKADDLRPLLAKAGGRGAAIAGYFLVLLDSPEGLDPLIAYWRKSARTDGAWIRLVYQAIAYVGEDRYVPVLEEIYAKKAKNDSETPPLYWTIRPMEGPRAKALRARIRKEVGMASLQR
jgi:hypothetical protein